MYDRSKFFNMESVKGKKLLIMGGTQISCEIIRAAKDMGIYTMVADYNPLERSPGKRIADKHFLIDVTDVEAVSKLIRQEKVEGVLVGFNDMLLPYYAEVCRITGLPSYGTKEQFELFINKDQYKALCRKFDVPTVEEYEINPENPKLSMKQIFYPVLVKPADNSGARGITICENEKQLRMALKKARNFTKTGKILVERYLPGKEVTVNWLFQNGKYYLTCIANRHVKNGQGSLIPLPVGYTYPASVTDRYQLEIAPNVKRMFQEVKIQNGMMFMQCKIEADKCVVYDIGYRLTGTQEYKNITAVCGYNPMEMMIYYALTGKMAEKSIEEWIIPGWKKYTYNVSFLTKPGKIGCICGLEELKKIPGYIDAVIEHYPGEEITREMKGLLAQISLRVFGTADSQVELWERIKEVQNRVKILSDSKENMVLPGLERLDIDDVMSEDKMKI